VLPHGITLSCRAGLFGAAGEDAPRVLMLHGFPEGAFIWDGVIERLVIGCIASRRTCALRAFERANRCRRLPRQHLVPTLR